MGGPFIALSLSFSAPFPHVFLVHWYVWALSLISHHPLFHYWSVQKTSQIPESCPAQAACWAECVYVCVCMFTSAKWDFGTHSTTLALAVAGCVHNYGDPVCLGGGHYVVTEALRLMEEPYKGWCSISPSSVSSSHTHMHTLLMGYHNKCIPLFSAASP